MKNGHSWTERNVILGKNTHLFQSCYLGLVSSQHLGNGRLRYEPWHDFGRKLSLQNFKQPETLDSTQLPYFLPPSLLPLPSFLPFLPSSFSLLSLFLFFFLFWESLSFCSLEWYKLAQSLLYRTAWLQTQDPPTSAPHMLDAGLCYCTPSVISIQLT